jgi:hypothetical protein
MIFKQIQDISDHYPVGVMIQGSVSDLYSSSSANSSEPRAPPSEVRVSVSVDLPRQPCWSKVFNLMQVWTSESQKGCPVHGLSELVPQVAISSNLAVSCSSIFDLH